MPPKIVFFDLPGSAALPPRDVLNVAGHGAQLSFTSSVHEALKQCDTSVPLAVVANHADKELYSQLRDNHPNATAVLLTEHPMHKYSEQLDGSEDKLLDHIIAVYPAIEWTYNELRVTLQKIVQRDIFGIEKYLAPATKVHQAPITGSRDRDPLNQKVMLFAEDCQLSQQSAKMIYGISEELLMNAIYDAPAAAGVARYQGQARTAAVELEQSEYATLSYGCDGHIFALSVSDPFGRMTQAKLFQYLKKVLMRRDSEHLIDKKEGGAGLGLFKILYSCHSLVCNVDENKRTETMALIDTISPLRDFAKMARSIHFFSLKNEQSGNTKL